MKRSKQAESLLWSGQVNEVINLFNSLIKKSFKTFCNYLETHRNRIVNYQYYLEESLSSIGSGTVESTIKRVGRLGETIGSAVEYRECFLYPFSSLCLSQWSTFHLMYLQKWDAPAHALNPSCTADGFNFLANALNTYIYHIRIRIKIITPDMFEDLCAGEYPTGRSH